MKNSKKIIILGLILLIIAGIIVVALKGFRVSLMFGKHEVIELKIGKDLNLDTINEICDEVFKNKKYVVKEKELFNDSFQVSVESLTDEEKTNLISKVNEKFEIEKTADDLLVESVSNQRIRDIVRPYIVPMIIIYAIVYVYMLIRFRKVNTKSLILKELYKTVLIEAFVLSIVAIARIPVNEVLINIIMLIAIGELVYWNKIGEKELSKI